MISKNYILIYYQQIKDGSVTVGEWITRWYEYIVHGLEEKRFFFDQKKAARAIAFIQQYCRHHEGPLAPQLIQLEVWQKALISIGRKDLNEMIQEGKDVELNCHFCNTNYVFSVEELKAILRKCK